MTEKLTNTSDDGIETVTISLRGDAPQGKIITVGISTPTSAGRSGDLSFVGVPDAGGYLGHIFAEGEWRRFGAVSQERDRSFYKFDQIGIGQSGVGVFNFKDSFECNGVAKIKDLFVSGMVTFAANQSFAGVSYDTLVIKKNANFWGYNTTGGISYEGIPWENHGYTIHRCMRLVLPDFTTWKLLVHILHSNLHLPYTLRDHGNPHLLV